MAKKYDAVVIGGGHNGLVNAAYLAKAGLKVLVLERRHILGGATLTEEIVPGFKFSVFSYVVSLLRPEIIRELELAKHGLEILPLDGTITPLDDDYLWRVNDHGKTIRELRRWSLSDAEVYEEYGSLMAEMGRFIKPILSIAPPDPGKITPSHWLPLGPLAKAFKDLPKKLQTTFIQLMTMSAADFLDQWFETEPLKATMSASGIIGTFQGPRSPGTAYVLLHHYMGEIDGAFRAWGVPRGGTGAVAYAIANSALSLGVEIRTEAGVDHVKTAGRSRHRRRARERRGDRRRRGDVVAGLAPDVHQAARRIRPRPDVPRRGHALQVPRFVRQGEPGADRSARARVQARRRGVAPRRDQLHRRRSTTWSAPTTTRSTAGPSERPYIDCIMPTLVDPSMAPPGKHVMSCFVQYAPYHLENGEQWDDAKREAFGQNVIDTLEERFPDIRNLIEGHQFVTPKDIEDITGLSEGNIFAGRALARAAVLQPAGARVGALRDAGAGPVDVRLGDPPRRRHHGCARHDRGARVPEAKQARAEGGLMALKHRRDSD